MAKTPCSQCRGPGFDPWSGNQILRAATKTWHSQLYIYIYIYDLKGKSFTRPVTIKLSPVSEKKSLIFYYGRKLTFIEDTSMIVFSLVLGGFI